jgi:glycosyltransferase involved in cell wall biosynthesis
MESVQAIRPKLRLSLQEAFVEAVPNVVNQPPLTPFMVHTWRMNDIGRDPSTRSPEEVENFLYWFYGSLHRRRAPYSWVVPPGIAEWLNVPVVASEATPRLEGRPNRYLTRFMQHVWKEHKNDLDVRRPDGFLGFLTWFALDCMPEWNLPRVLLPGDLADILNTPVRSGLPLTAGMLAAGLAAYPDRFKEASRAPDAEIIAMAFEMLPKTLRARDPRLIPASASHFWSARLGEEHDSVNAYEYLAAATCKPEVKGDPGLLRSWFFQDYLSFVPEAAPLLSVPPDAQVEETTWEDRRPPSKAIFVYRDHRTIAGLSKAGVLLRDALRGSGAKVTDLDFSFGRERMAEEHAYNSRQFCAAGQKVHLFALNPEYVPECVMCHLAHIDADGGYFIGQFYWELSDTSAVHDCGLSLVDEIWVATKFLREVYRKRTDVPVYVIGQSIDGPVSRQGLGRNFFRLPADAYTFLFGFDAGSVVERKNPLAAAQAFMKAFPQGDENAVLVLKTRNTDGHLSAYDRAHWRKVEEMATLDRRIRIVDATMSEEELQALYQVCDCYVSLHRSEGFGFGPAEAMASGKPVIATGYSGVTDFCTPETSLLVNYSRERVPKGAYPFMDDDREYYWASPDVDHAAGYLRALYEDPEQGRRLGRAGRQFIGEIYNPRNFQQRCVERLAELNAI